MHWIRNVIPYRYFVWLFSGIAFIASLGLLWWNPLIGSTPSLLFGALTLLGSIDFFQKKQAIRRNYPIMAHFRFLFESIRPEIRQYFLESDTEAIPFSRAQRSLVYQRAKGAVDKKAYGTLTDVYEAHYEWINHSVHTVKITDTDFRVMIGEGQCQQPYSLSIFNISAMSFGALSANAIQALNKGAKMGHFAHDTGEGSISSHHRLNGGDLIWEIGSGYFGCRTPDGRFDPERFAENARDPQVKMIEIKLSQGAKPGHGGILPAAKVTEEIAAARGVEPWVDCISPSCHSAFSTPVELMNFIAQLRELSGGKPIGFKLCIGHPWEFFAICKAMLKTGITPDYIVVDGAEGGTAAAPVEFSDHMGTPMHEGLVLAHNTLVGLNLRDRVKIGAAGKIVSAFDIARTMALGADWCNSGRGFMFALGCIMAQTCHTGRCPTGVATQSWLRQRALDPADKATRVYNFHKNTLKAVAELTGAAGLSHPNQLRPHHIVRRLSINEVALVSALIAYLKPGDLLDNRAAHPVYQMFWDMASPDTFAAVAPAEQVVAVA
ncbi:FMN-binding glutamate synthase family protein [Perlucidibaca piscinae]|uniref:FMN-binding glutamate synthase family protein n=1 Tax=Perlucidibaca piscinae TaxID=392589 RepID=UPI0003B2F1AD|nr:FMN-binding glutamate synthase family protein [Perlucidibaca piscinae]